MDNWKKIVRTDGKEVYVYELPRELTRYEKMLRMSGQEYLKFLENLATLELHNERTLEFAKEYTALHHPSSDNIGLLN